MNKLYQDKIWLYKKYWKEMLNVYEIAKICNVMPSTIWCWMKRHKIHCRNKSEAKRGKLNPFFGKHHSKKTRIIMSKIQRGKKISEKQKQMQSKKMKGRFVGQKNPMFGIHRFGKDNPNYGNHHTEETKRKYSIQRQGKQCGQDNPNWQGGRSLEFYDCKFNKKLKIKIRERDNYQCQLCGVKQNGRKLPIHHVDHNKKNNESINLITLCDLHNIKANYNRGKWQFFFEAYQEVRGVGNVLV